MLNDYCILNIINDKFVPFINESYGDQKHEARAAIIPVNWRSLETNEYRKYRNICC